MLLTSLSAKMRDKTRVNDLFEGAYLLIQGFELEDLSIQSSRGRKVVTFILKGEHIEDATRDYRSGQAMANVKQLKATVDRLKDLMFHQIRKAELHQSARETLRAQGELSHARVTQA